MMNEAREAHQLPERRDDAAPLLFHPYPLPQSAGHDALTGSIVPTVLPGLSMLTAMSASTQALRTRYCAPISLMQATRDLRVFVTPCRLTGAAQIVRAHWREVAILAQYRRCFPAEFADSPARQARTPDEPYAPRELEFFRLVEQRLFPIDADSYEMAEDAGERSLDIRVLTYGVDLDDGYDLRPGWCLLGFLAGAFVGDYAGRLLMEQLESLRERDWRLLERWEKELPAVPSVEDLERLYHDVDLPETAPLRHLDSALAMLLHRTGTLWLDPYPEQEIIDVEWTTSIVEQLRAEWCLAEQLADRAYQLVDWLEADPIPHTREVVRLWKLAIQSRQPR